MMNNIAHIFTKIIAAIMLLIVLYILLVFLAPEFADQYGNADWNHTIRQWKNSSLDMVSEDGSLNLPIQ